MQQQTKVAVMVRRLVGLPRVALGGLTVALALGCGPRESPGEAVQHTEPSAGGAPEADPSAGEHARGERSPTPTLAEQAVVAAFGSPESAGQLIVAAMADLDGLAGDDTIFANNGERGCVLVRIAPGSTRVDVLPPPLGGPPAVTRCVETARTETGSLVLVSAYNGVSDMRQGVIQLYAVTPAADATVVYQEMFPFTAEWGLRSVTPTQVELMAAHTEMAGVPDAIYKMMQAQESGRWGSASCWSPVPATGPVRPLQCPVTLGDGIPERRLEGQTFGPPAYAGQAVVIGAGQPATTTGAPRTWCVAFEDGRSGWLALPPALTASCSLSL